MTDKLTLTIAEVADLAGVGRSVVESAIVRGELPAKFVGEGKRYRRVLRKHVEPWLDQLPEA